MTAGSTSTSTHCHVNASASPGRNPTPSINRPQGVQTITLSGLEEPLSLLW
jgi:hypothetical protein